MYNSSFNLEYWLTRFISIIVKCCRFFLELQANVDIAILIFTNKMYSRLDLLDITNYHVKCDGTFRELKGRCYYQVHQN